MSAVIRFKFHQCRFPSKPSLPKPQLTHTCHFFSFSFYFPHFFSIKTRTEESDLFIFLPWIILKTQLSKILKSIKTNQFNKIDCSYFQVGNPDWKSAQQCWSWVYWKTLNTCLALRIYFHVSNHRAWQSVFKWVTKMGHNLRFPLSNTQVSLRT